MAFSSSALAAYGIAASAAAAGYSATQQAGIAKAQTQANNNAISAQNTAFWSNNSNQQRQLAAQSSAEQQAQQQSGSSFDTMRQKQQSALDQSQQVLAQENQQADQIKQQADTQQQNLLAATNAQQLANAQSGDAANRVATMAPVSQNVQTASPLGDTNSDSSDVKQAFASRLSQAASTVRDYGQKLAQVSSYTAPLTTVGQAITNEQTGIMPVAAANQLLQSGQQIRLLPSQTAYQQAGTEGAAQQQAIQAALQGNLNVAKADFTGSGTVTDLALADSNTAGKNAVTGAQNQAAQDQAYSGLVGQLGNLTAYGASRYGGGLSGLAQIFSGAPASTQPTQLFPGN